MSTCIAQPAEITTAGGIPKIIQEFIGRVNTGTETVSIAKMHSAAGWSEPGQTPAFDEYTIVLQGTVCIKTKEGLFEISAGQAFIAPRGEWVQYSTPEDAEYIAVCVPAFSPGLAHRDAE
ncbi:MAG: cupin [Deltaproteobacteria bacterium]|nr:cupin [Deltaproteobacteria bacterium]